MASLTLALTLAGWPAQVERLGHPRYAVREAAYRALARQPAESALRNLARPNLHPDAEVRARCGRLWSDAADRWVSARDPLPWIDANWYDADRREYADPSPDTELGRARIERERYLTLAQQSPASGQLGPWPYYRLATRMWLCQSLADGVPPADLDATLAVMRDRDRVFLGGNR